MELFIRIVDGQPFEHPIHGDNFRQAFPDVDTDNLPPEFARFIRVRAPSHGRFEKASVSYQWVDGVVMDVWTVEPMSSVEIEAQAIQERAAAFHMRDIRIERCNKVLADLEDAGQRKLWLDCLDAHEEWVFETLVPLTPPFPVFPKRDEAGNWVAA